MKLHLRLQGRSRTEDAHRLGLSDHSSDAEIRQKLARFLDLSPQDLSRLMIDRHPDGVVVRPPAVFG
ncbi:MAG: hypothetical protein AB1758_29505 [Candidatus Eremiobacterota bacterium]